MDNGALSYAELDARANQRARMFAAHGVGQGDFVTVALPNGAEFYETTFALWKLGAIPNIIAAKLARPEMEAIVEIVRPKLLVGSVEIAGLQTVAAEKAALERYSADPMPETLSPHWKAMTSGGSTGRPKVILDAMPGRWNPDEGFCCNRRTM
ncbi:MAG: AMP-binding protein [Hyphomonadaceae bacterium JAD_PAG50586_4]|nr:MAG: AMP-binding protein [Hyphomonadaceae bacterium JAD_PAG50586_4]